MVELDSEDYYFNEDGLMVFTDKYLKKRGYLYLEHSPDQAKELKLFLKELNFKNISEIFDLNGDKRAIKAQNS